MLYIRGEYFLFKKRLHHLLKIVLPLGAVWLGFMLVLVPGMQVRKLVYSSYQKSVWVKIEIYRYAVPFAGMRGTIIAKLAAAVTRNFKLTFKVIYPAANKWCRIRGKILC